MRNYETTILVDANQARADFDGVLAAVREVYEVEGAEWIELEKWDERKLTFQISGQNSACYLVGYFKADPAIVERIERRAELGDAILRQLIISRDGHGYDKIREQRAAKAAAAAAAATEA